MANWSRFVLVTDNNKCRDITVSLLSARPVIIIGFDTVTVEVIVTE